MFRYGSEQVKEIECKKENSGCGDNYFNKNQIHKGLLYSACYSANKLYNQNE